MPIFPPRIFFWLILCVSLFTSEICPAQDRPVAVLISREINPYVEMVKGFESAFKNHPVQRFFLDKQGRPYSLEGGSVVFEPQKYAALVAVGPEALHYLQPLAKDIPLFFGMILNPESFFSATLLPVCGVNLNIPIKNQFAEIVKLLPGKIKLGVLFDPVNNQVWFEQAQGLARNTGIDLVPLHVQRIAGRLNMEGDFAPLDAILFIPDRTVINKPFIQYLTKKALLTHIPVIGYNHFFLDSGSAMAFLIDYAAVGRQVATQVTAVLGGAPCPGIVPPEFTTTLNSSVWQLLKPQPSGGHK